MAHFDKNTCPQCGAPYRAKAGEEVVCAECRGIAAVPLRAEATEGIAPETMSCPECAASIRVWSFETETRCTGCGTLLEVMSAAPARASPRSLPSADSKAVQDLQQALRELVADAGWWKPPAGRAKPPQAVTPPSGPWAAGQPVWDVQEMLKAVEGILTDRQIILASPSSPRRAQRTPRPLGAREVLVVDDMPEMLDWMRAVLERLGEPQLRIETVSDPHRALHLVRTHHYDLVVSDAIMPDVDGLDLLQEACEAYPQGGRILLTASKDDLSRKPAYVRASPHAYVRKPVGPQEMVREVRKVLEQVLAR